MYLRALWKNHFIYLTLEKDDKVDFSIKRAAHAARILRERKLLIRLIREGFSVHAYDGFGY